MYDQRRRYPRTTKDGFCNMKVVITGHTKGVGLALYNHFVKHNCEVIGISRATGYDLAKDVDRVVELAAGCDLFINNACVGNCQLELLEQLHSRVGKMVVMGSIAGDYHQLIQSEYSQNKLNLANRCREISLLPTSNVLHLKISMLEDAVSGDILVSFSEVVAIVKFWISNHRISEINLEFKLTPFTLEKIKSKFGATQEAIDYVLANMCNEKREQFN